MSKANIPYVTPSDVAAYNAGIAEGRRLERRAMKRMIQQYKGGFEKEYILCSILDTWLAARSKRGKGKR